ncbi:MAG: ABC transporter substrate-binding protein [Nitrospirae bacterium]|jgi:NitT/TauT family transport system substrate-binding protein|nr:ABC transporter substrate-binding protein [Nitrospirota bacterium]
MEKVTFSLLRGICQMPAYVAHEKGFFKEEGIHAMLSIEPTAWMVPNKLMSGECQFAVIPWTRVAAAEEKDIPLVLISGSGFEEAAIVIRKGISTSDVKRVAIPQRGGMKDLTAMGLIENLGWKDVELVRLPSGDGAIIALFGMGADAASMVEPYATMMEGLGVGTVVKRTGDIWQGAPGCSLTTTVQMKETAPETVQSVVKAFVRGAIFVRDNPDESAEISSGYIGISVRFIRDALNVNRPDVDAIRNRKAMENVLSLMMKLGYIEKLPTNYSDLTFLDRAAGSLGS